MIKFIIQNNNSIKIKKKNSKKYNSNEHMKKKTKKYYSNEITNEFNMKYQYIKKYMKK